MRIETIPFTIKDYNSGRYKVATVGGSKVRILCTDRVSATPRPIVGLLRLEHGEVICPYYEDGKAVDHGLAGADLELKNIIYEEGDIITFKTISHLRAIDGQTVIAIVDSTDESGITCKVYLRMGNLVLTGVIFGYDEMGKLRIATKEEEDILLKSLIRIDRTYDKDKKCIVKLPDPNMKQYSFKPYDKVLGKVGFSGWNIDFFIYYDSAHDRYKCFRGIYDVCIPYEGNENLYSCVDK